MDHCHGTLVLHVELVECTDPGCARPHLAASTRAELRRTRLLRVRRRPHLGRLTSGNPNCRCRWCTVVMTPTVELRHFQTRGPRAHRSSRSRGLPSGGSWSDGAPRPSARRRPGSGSARRRGLADGIVDASVLRRQRPVGPPPDRARPPRRHHAPPRPDASRRGRGEVRLAGRSPTWRSGSPTLHEKTPTTAYATTRRPTAGSLRLVPAASAGRGGRPSPRTPPGSASRANPAAFARSRAAAVTAPLATVPTGCRRRAPDGRA